MVVEDARAREEFGDAVAPLVDTHQALEKNAWSLVGSFLTPEQVRGAPGSHRRVAQGESG